MDSDHLANTLAEIATAAGRSAQLQQGDAQVASRILLACVTGVADSVVDVKPQPAAAWRSLAAQICNWWNSSSNFATDGLSTSQVVEAYAGAAGLIPSENMLSPSVLQRQVEQKQLPYVAALAAAASSRKDLQPGRLGTRDQACLTATACAAVPAVPAMSMAQLDQYLSFVVQISQTPPNDAAAAEEQQRQLGCQQLGFQQRGCSNVGVPAQAASSRQASRERFSCSWFSTAATGNTC